MTTQRWVVEEHKESGWDTAGWIEAPGPAQAVTIAATQWRDVAGLQLRAILWSHATPEQQEAADYERNLRIHLHETSGAPGTFADKWARGELPLDVNTPQRAVAYREGNVARLGWRLAIATPVVVLLLLIFTRPDVPMLAVAGVIGLFGAVSGHGRARSGLLEVGNELAGSQTSYGVPGYALLAALVIALVQKSWLAAVIYVAAFFLGALIGIALSILLSANAQS